MDGTALKELDASIGESDCAVAEGANTRAEDEPIHSEYHTARSKATLLVTPLGKEGIIL